MSSRGKEHAADVVMTEVDIEDTLVPALKSKPEAAVEDCLDERDIAFNRLKLNHVPSVQKSDSVIQCVRGLLRLWKDGIGLPIKLPDRPLLLTLYHWGI